MRPVRVPRELQERALTVERFAEELIGDLSRTPTSAAIAARAGLTLESVVEARLAGSAHHGVSLDLPVGDDEPGETLGDRLAVSEPGFARSRLLQGSSRVISRAITRLRDACEHPRATAPQM